MEEGDGISAAGSFLRQRQGTVFSEQSFTGIACDGGEEKSWDCIFSIPIMWGAAIIIRNASYAVKSQLQGNIWRHW